MNAVMCLTVCGYVFRNGDQIMLPSILNPSQMDFTTWYSYYTNKKLYCIWMRWIVDARSKILNLILCPLFIQPVAEILESTKTWNGVFQKSFEITNEVPDAFGSMKLLNQVKYCYRLFCKTNFINNCYTLAAHFGAKVRWWLALFSIEYTCIS